MLSRILVILRKELLQALREPRMRWLLFAPPGREEEIQYLMDHGEVEAIVRVLPGFASDIERGRTAAVQVLVEGSNSNTASLVSGYANQVVANYSATLLSQEMAQKKMARSPTTAVNLSAPDVASRVRVWFNPELKSRNYFVPGVVANIIMMVTLMLTALAIVREKEIGTMEQLMVTPIRPIELMIGKTLPFAAVGLMDVLLVTTAAILLFHIPLRGNPLLLGSAALFLLTSLGAGLYLSTISNTQQQAMMASFFFSMPCFMLSGFTFPIRNMPLPVQYLTYLNPLRYFMEIVRGVFLKGTGFSVLWPQLLILAVYGLSVLILSALRFRKRLD